ncbi:response regulator transcription factor [Serratia sp. P2ACOL2]|uniref:response regulator transcription factor n=1 Tax=Serratia sp. P2ACOL2 TaxID=2482769 RepID=UPI000EFCDCAF|nr:helix-turn-helix transcriptional regulator [Serratia sp. P2ACOL2]AYO39792.1 LuxR family transcriptional regulator [Serratia sp. P2ACOL2]
MKPNVTILLVEPNLYFALGFSQGLRMHFNNLGVDVHISENLLDKNHCDMVFLAAEQDTARLRYLTQRRTTPSHQRIFVFKEKPGQYDSTQFKNLDGIFYRHQSMSWAMQIATQGLHNLTLPNAHKSPSVTHQLSLTDREVEILRYLANGQRACEISHYLHISAKTVSGHKRNAMAKLGITRTSDLNYWLIRGGIGQLATQCLPASHRWNTSANSLCQGNPPLLLLPYRQSKQLQN